MQGTRKSPGKDVESTHEAMAKHLQEETSSQPEGLPKENLTPGFIRAGELSPGKLHQRE